MNNPEDPLWGNTEMSSVPGEPSVPAIQTIDRTEIIQTLRDEFSKKSEEQQAQIDNLVTSVNLLVTAINANNNNRPNATMAPPSHNQGKGPSLSTGQNVNQKTPPVANGTTSRESQSSRLGLEERSDQISLVGSNVWFNSVRDQSSIKPSTARSASTTESKENKKPGKEEEDVHEPSQVYWQDTTIDYETNQATGAEIAESSIASAAKIIWHRPLKETVLTQRLEAAKTPANCPFLLPKKVNTEIWSKMGTFNRTSDCKLQDALKFHAASTTMMLKAASTLTSCFKEKMPKEIKTSLIELKDSMTLAGKVSQQLNQARRDLIKPSLPSEYKKLASEADETSDFLFGSELCDQMEKLRKENKLCSLLSKEKGERKKSDSKNSYPSQKSQKRGQYGQRQSHKDKKGKQDHRKPYHKRN